MHTHHFKFDQPFKLKSGQVLSQYELVVETYGQLNSDKSNAVLICHALNASHHVAGQYSPEDPHPHKQGWWDNMVGSNKPIDTNRFFVICVNNLGSCFGSTGPNSTMPNLDTVYAEHFPLVTVEDWVHTQKKVIDLLGIKQLFAVIGGSLGGMQAFSWSVLYPDSLKKCAVIASAPKLSAQNIAFNEVARQAILNDISLQLDAVAKQDFAGLKLARMLGHITYLSDEDMGEKFGREETKIGKQFSFNAEFEVERYLRYQADKFANYFNPYTYLLFTKALDYFDASFDFGSLEQACMQTKCQFLLVAFSTDWRFSPERSKEWVHALLKTRKPVSFLTIEAMNGHDAFLMHHPHYHQAMRCFLQCDNA